MEQKIALIEKYLEDFEKIIPRNFVQYSSDIRTRAACERYIEKISMALVDLAYLIIRTREWKNPDEDSEAFSILVSHRIISADLATRLKKAKGLRNVLSHQYGEVDDEVVFSSMQKLRKDAREFVAIAQSLLLT